MIISTLKKVCLLSFIIVGCGAQLLAEPAKQSFFAATNGCDNDFKNFKTTIERFLSAKFKEIDCELAQAFADRNEFIHNKMKSLTISLEEFIACQTKTNTIGLEDFIVCELGKTEEQIEEFVVLRADCLKAFFCQQITDLRSLFGLLGCTIDSVNIKVTCLNDLLLAYMEFLNDEVTEEITNPFLGAFSDVVTCVSEDISLCGSFSAINCPDVAACDDACGVVIVQKN